MVTSWYGNALGITGILLRVVSDIQVIILTDGQYKEQPVDFPYKEYVIRSFAVLFLLTCTHF